jgi:hypothetical protein
MYHPFSYLFAAVSLEHKHYSGECTTYTEDLDVMLDGLCRHILYECNTRSQYLIIDLSIVMCTCVVPMEINFIDMEDKH